MEKKLGFLLTVALCSFSSIIHAQPSPADIWVVVGTRGDSPIDTPSDIQSYLVSASGRIKKHLQGWWFAINTKSYVLTPSARVEHPCDRCVPAQQSCPPLVLDAKLNAKDEGAHFVRDTAPLGMVQTVGWIAPVAQLGSMVWVRERHQGKDCQSQHLVADTIVAWNTDPTARPFDLQAWWRNARTTYQVALADAFKKDHPGPTQGRRLYDDIELQSMIEPAQVLARLANWDSDGQFHWLLLVQVPSTGNTGILNQLGVWSTFLRLDTNAFADKPISLSAAMKRRITALSRRGKRHVIGMSTALLHDPFELPLSRL